MPLARFAPALLALGLPVGAMAADFGAPAVPPAVAVERSWRLFDEGRFGLFAHDPGSPEQGSVDLNGEILSSRLPLIDPASGWSWLAPRLHAGGTLNFDGKTSHLYAGLTWTVDVTERFFVDASFGGAVHNGDTGTFVARGMNGLGCSPLFRESASVGYRFAPGWSVMATIEHLSNAGLCAQNRGLTNIGMRVGHQF